MTRQEMIDALTDAQDKLGEVIDLLQQVARVDSHNSSWAESYLIAHLQTLASDNHSYLSRDRNIGDWIEMIEAEADEVDADADLEFDRKFAPDYAHHHIDAGAINIREYPEADA